MHQQQDQQQRSTFYRANRPGNLNIIDINENQLQIQHSPLIQQHQQLQQQQQQQQQMLMPPSSSPYLNQNYKVHQSPLAPPPIPYSSNHMLTSTPNQQSNYVPQSLAPPISPAAINSNNNANNTHYPTSPSYNIVNKQQQKYQQQQQQQPQYSPSYTTNNTNNTNPQTPYAAASYTPNYSPCQSSANIVNKQTQYFNFDASNINNNNNNNNNNNIQSIPQQSPRLFNSNSNNNTNSTNITSANNNGSTNLYHQSNQGTTSRYTQQQQKLQNGNYHHQSNFGNNGNVYQFQNNYHKMPSTPQSAIPMSSTSTNNLYVNHNHSLSVPNSPLVNNNNNNSNSIFQFNMSIQQSLQDTTPSVLKTRQYIENQQQQQQQQEKILNTSYEFETNEPNDQHCEVTDEIGETAEIKTNTYGENEIEMVEQVLNDMMQKEEIIKVTSVESNSIDATNCEINNTDDLVISNDNDDDNNNISTPTNNNNNNNDDDDDDESLIKNNEASLLTNNIDFNQTNSTIPLNSTSASTPNTNITNSTNSNVSFEKDNKTYNKIDNNTDMNKNNINNNNNKNSVFSLSNLSAAASAEFEYMFNFNNDTANKQQRIDNNNNNNNETYKNFNNNKTNIALITKQQQQQQQHLNDSSLKLKQYDADINEFQKNNFNNKTMSQEIKKEAYPSKMDLDQQNIFNNNNNNSKSSITDRDISYKFSVLDQPINMNHKNKLINRSIQGDEFSISSTNSSINNGNNNNNNNNTAQNCSDCGKIFTNKSALAKHRLIHSNERKYACHLCDKSFKRQDHLNGHLLTHQDKKPFECKAPGCDKSYCDSRSLKRHVESQHQDYLEAVARGNHQVLNYLPNIGKLKANVAPNLQHEIIVNETQATTSNMDRMQYSPITPVINSIAEQQQQQQQHHNNNKNESLLGLNNRPKHIFTFEEPKPETCRICGRGFKNIPALNGHMRLHGGFIKTSKTSKASNSTSNTNTTTKRDSISNNNLDNIPINEDSMSSNNSFSSSFQSDTDSKNLKESQLSIDSNDSKFNQYLPSVVDNLNTKLINNNNNNINNIKNDLNSSYLYNNKSVPKFSTPKQNKDSKTIHQKIMERNMRTVFKQQQQQQQDLMQPEYEKFTENQDEYKNESDQVINSRPIIQDNYNSISNPFNYTNNNCIISNNSQYYYANEKISNDLNELSDLNSKKPQINNTNSNPPSKFISNLLQQKQNNNFDSFSPFNPQQQQQQNKKQFSTNDNEQKQIFQNIQNKNKSNDDDYCMPPWATSTIKPNESIKNNTNQLFCLPNQGQQQPSTDLSNVNLSSSKSFSQSYPSSLSFNSDNNNNINSNSSSSSINGVNNSISSSSNSSSSSSISSTATISGNNQNDEIFESLSKKIDNYTNSLKKDQINNENNYSIQSHLSQDSISSPQISTNNNNNNNTKQKIKPNPLVIPSAISAFQQQNHAANILQVSQAAAAAAAVAVTNPQFSSFQQQLSNTYAIYAAAAAMAHHMGPPYPNATLLKSPRLFNNYDFNSPEYNFNLKKQYTPPPMLSPFRKGPGLFCNSKQFANYLPQTLFSFQSQQHHHHVFKPTPQYSHSLSENHLGSNYTLNNTYQNNINNNNIKLGTSFDPNFSKMNNNNNNNNNNDNKHSHSDDDSNDEDTSINVKKIVDKTIESETNFIQIDDSDSNNSNDSVVISNSNKPALLNSSSYLSTKSSLKRPRLSSQTSHPEILFPNDSNLSEEAKAANETIAAALNDFNESNIKPFINEGDEYQAIIPKLRKLDKENDYEEEKQDLMSSGDLLASTFESEQFENYLQIISKGSFIYGSSNNLELGLHILNYFDGNFEKAIKTFLDDSINLPSGHPISTYKYNETEIWSRNEIKQFEKAILKFDKSFSEISTEIQTKTTKQCIEFYYLWKKVMCDGVKKKWRTLKKNRNFDSNREIKIKVENDPTQKQSSNDVSSKSKTERHECVKCNLVFKTKRKLRTHFSQKHNTKKNEKQK